MKKNARLPDWVCAIMMILAIEVSTFAQDITPTTVSSALKASAEWQIANLKETNLNGWIIAPYYDGLIRTALSTGDARYLAAVISYGKRAGWAPGSRTYHADDQAVGHAWLDVYMLDQTRGERLAPMKNRLDYVISHPVTADLEFGKSTPSGVNVTDRWTWCDALYMAPPTLTRLYQATGDTKHLNFLYREYRYTYDMLYDPAEGFFYRDSRYIGDRTSRGKKVFWSRGNGWVYGGLALLLDQLPEDYQYRSFFETLFQEMTVAVAGAQQSDGLWRPSLADPLEVPDGETSGSGFFTFGLAWGVNTGRLERATYWPVVEAGWRGLLTRVGSDGYVGYVQQPGAAPGSFTASSTREYGTGAFLLAGSEVLRGIDTPQPVDPVVLLTEAESILNPPPADGSRLVNLSTRLLLGVDDVAVQGFVAEGSSDVPVLIRAIGPSLTDLGITTPELDPEIILFRGSQEVGSNDDWRQAEIGDAFDRAGAFSLPYPSRDAAMVVGVTPGSEYTVHVRGGTGGVVLIEVYQLPAPVTDPFQ